MSTNSDLPSEFRAEADAVAADGDLSDDTDDVPEIDEVRVVTETGVVRRGLQP